MAYIELSDLNADDGAPGLADAQAATADFLQNLAFVKGAVNNPSADPAKVKAALKTMQDDMVTAVAAKAPANVIKEMAQGLKAAQTSAVKLLAKAPGMSDYAEITASPYFDLVAARDYREYAVQSVRDPVETEEDTTGFGYFDADMADAADYTKVGDSNWFGYSDSSLSDSSLSDSSLSDSSLSDSSLSGGCFVSLGDLVETGLGQAAVALSPTVADSTQIPGTNFYGSFLTAGNLRAIANQYGKVPFSQLPIAPSAWVVIFEQAGAPLTQIQNIPFNDPVFMSNTLGSAWQQLGLDATNPPSATTAAATTATTATATGTAASVTVTPNPATVVAGATLALTATVKDASGNAISNPVTWTAAGGTIDQNGNFTAPATPGSYEVIATSGGVVGYVTVTVTATAAATAPVLTTITVTPNPVSVAAGATTQFTAAGKNQNGNTISATITWVAAGGTVDQNGNYTAPSTAGTYDVLAMSGGVTGWATVNVAASAAVATTAISSIIVTPRQAQVSPNGSYQFTAQAKDVNGVALTTQPSFSWTATTGSVTQSGLFTAPSAPAVVTVQATAQGPNGTVSGSARVSVGQGAGGRGPARGHEHGRGRRPAGGGGADLRNDQSVRQFEQAERNLQNQLVQIANLVRNTTGAFGGNTWNNGGMWNNNANNWQVNNAATTAQNYINQMQNSWNQTQQRYPNLSPQQRQRFTGAIQRAQQQLQQAKNGQAPQNRR